MGEKKKKFEYGFYHDSLTECYKKFGGIFEQPIIQDHNEEAISYYSRGNILDIGAGKEQPFVSFAKAKLKDGKYYTLDNDPHGKFDFQSFDEIPKNLKFNLIVANQLFEHLDVEEAMEFIVNIENVLEKGGIICATVPNIAHPNRQISNITHKTAWGYNSFYMLFRYTHLEVLKYARYSKRYPKGLIEKFLAKQMQNIYRIDWADSLMVIAKKN